MKILLINKFLCLKGGDAISTLTTGHLLEKKGHKIIFWGMKHPFNPDYPYKDYFVSYIDFNKSMNVVQQFMATLRILYSLEAKSKIESLLRTEKPDIVHLNNFAHQISPSILHVFARHKIPTVMSMRDYKLVCPSYTMLTEDKPCEKCKNGHYYQCVLHHCAKNSYFKSALNMMEMYLHHNIMHIYDLVDVFISPSRFLKNKLEEMGFKRNIVYLPNFVHLEEFSTQFNWQDNSIVYFGRLSKEKGLLTLIEAVKDLDVKLKIIGEGPLKSNFKFKIKNEKLSNVELLGYKSGEELTNEIQKSMFVVLPSEWYENNPRSIIEGFALGKPAVGSRIGGIPELIKNNETGLTFEPGNAEDLRSKIKYLIDNPDKVVEMGRNGRAFVERELNAERHYQRLMEIYEQAISQKEKP